VVVVEGRYENGVFAVSIRDEGVNIQIEKNTDEKTFQRIMEGFEAFWERFEKTGEASFRTENTKLTWKGALKVFIEVL